MAGIYIHIPFCRKACIYCDFHFSTSLGKKNALVNSIVKEIQARKSYIGDQPVETIYFGGGTPSLLTEAELSVLLEAIHLQFKVSEKPEITLEANPDDLDTSTLSRLLKVGVNRLSIGLQSFIDEELKWMNRSHSAVQNAESVLRAQQSGFKNISVDLIYGSKFQSEETWINALKKIEELNVQHLSCYNLTVEEKTELGSKVRKKKELNVDEDLSSKQFLMLMDWSRSSGFEQYEISNFARGGMYSKHNSSYWLGKDYLGLGPSAHSFNQTSRQWNISNNNLYIKNLEEGKPAFEMELLDERTRLNEYLLTRLRTRWGIDLDFLETNFSEKFLFPVRKNLHIETSYGNLLQEEKIVVLTEKGKLIADEVTKNLMV
jgi:oxygen-independent coproporphyrinogen III oxidase